LNRVTRCLSEVMAARKEFSVVQHVLTLTSAFKVLRIFFKIYFFNFIEIETYVVE